MSIEITQKYGKGVTYKGEDGNLYFKDEAGNVTSFTDPDQLVKISSDDTTASYLESKLVAGSNVTLTTNNSGGNETITIAAAADNDEKAKVSANDTTSGYLESKLVAGSNVTLTTNNDGGNETITIAASADNDEKVKVSANDTTSGYIEGKLVAGANVTLTTNNEGGNETLTIDAAGGGLTAFVESQNTASPNNTVNASRLLVDATSTNADIVLQAKGSGAILAQLPDGAVSGGNKRGAYAVDLQTSRSSAAQVASGAFSGVFSGDRNRASGQNSAVLSGTLNTTTGQNSAIGSGSQNTVAGIGSFVVGGSNSVTSNSEYSFTWGGATVAPPSNQNESSWSMVGGRSCRTTASASYSIVTGWHAVGSTVGVRVHSAGRFATSGDCQHEQYLMRIQTTDSVPTEITASGSAPHISSRILIASDSTCTFSALVTARRTDADNESAGYRIEGVIDNNAGTTAFVGTPVTTILGEDTAAWDVVVEADNTNDALVFKVTGETGKTIRWAATVELMKVAG